MIKDLVTSLTKTSIMTIVKMLFIFFTCFNLIIIFFAYDNIGFLRNLENPVPYIFILFFVYLLLAIAAFVFKKCYISIQFKGNITFNFRYLFLISVLAGLYFTIWFELQTPAHNDAWAVSSSRLAYGSNENGYITLYNVRDFKYDTVDSFVPQWQTRQFNLDDIVGCDWIVSHWAGDAIAHTMLAFRFKNAEPLVVSIETRALKGKEQSLIAGLFKKVNIIWIVGTENDILRLRTNHRKEDLYLYPIKIKPAIAQKTFLGILGKLNQLHEKSEFYNPLLHNCTTSYFTILPRDKNPISDIRLLINGYTDQMGFESGGFSDIKEGESFIMYRAKHLTNLKLEGQAITDSNYSELIRKPFKFN